MLVSIHKKFEHSISRISSDLRNKKIKFFCIIKITMTKITMIVISVFIVGINIYRGNFNYVIYFYIL